MAVQVVFHDYRVKCKDAINVNCESFLKEATGEIASQAADNSSVNTGQLKGSWGTAVNGNVGIVGSPLEYAIYQEMGTGEYAANGDGRKGGWYYVDADGVGHFTKGTKPKRMLMNAANSVKGLLEARARELFGGIK